MIRFVTTLLITLLIAGLSGCSKPSSSSVSSTPIPSVLRLPSLGHATNCSLSIGDVFPGIEAIDLTDAPRTLDKTMLGKKHTLVVFWSTWCGFCMTELPHEIELYEKYKDQGLAVVGINADKTAELGRTAAIENSVPWVNLYEGKERRVSNMLGVTSWPAIFLLDSDGKIIATDKFLRVTTVRTHADGEHRPVEMLDWTLETLFSSEASAE